MSNALAEYEMEGLPEFEWEEEGEWEHGEQFLGDIGRWVSDQWSAVTTPGTWQRDVALQAAKAGLPMAADAIGKAVGGGWGSAISKLGQAGVSLLPDKEYEAEGEFEEEFEAGLSPVRRIYLDAMMEHLGHEAAEAESEEEAARKMLPSVPMAASKVVPMAAKAAHAAPRAAAKAVPRVAHAVTRATPHLSRGVSNITKTLHQNPQTRPLVRAVPGIVRGTVNQIAKHAAAGRPVTPHTAQRVLAIQNYRVLTIPRRTAHVLRRNNVLDRR
jgi:hypothetical protein